MNGKLQFCLDSTMPIDINLLRVSRGGNPDLVRQSQKNRFASVELVDEVIELDDVIVLLIVYLQKWRAMTGCIDNLKKEKRLLSTAVRFNQELY